MPKPKLGAAHPGQPLSLFGTECADHIHIMLGIGHVPCVALKVGACNFFLPTNTTGSHPRPYI